MDWVDSYVKNNHEIQLKEMEIRAQQQTVLMIGVIVSILLVVLYVFFIKNKKNINNNNNNNNNILKDKLDKLEELYSDGILTEEEFRSKRKQILEKYEV